MSDEIKKPSSDFPFCNEFVSLLSKNGTITVDNDRFANVLSGVMGPLFDAKHNTGGQHDEAQADVGGEAEVEPGDNTRNE